MWDQSWAILAALVPSVGVGYLFYKVMRAIIEGDRNERLAHSQWEAEQERLRSAPDTAEHSPGAGPEQDGP